MIRRILTRLVREPAVWYLDRELAKLQRRLNRATNDSEELLAQAERELSAERAENARLVDQLKAAEERASLNTIVCQCGSDTEQALRGQLAVAHRRGAQDRRNAVALSDQLARAEGRPVFTRSTP